MIITECQCGNITVFSNFPTNKTNPFRIHPNYSSAFISARVWCTNFESISCLLNKWCMFSSELVDCVNLQHYSVFVFRPKSKRWFWIWKSIRKKLQLWWPAPMKRWPSTRLKLSRAWKLGKRQRHDRNGNTARKTSRNLQWHHFWKFYEVLWICMTVWLYDCQNPNFRTLSLIQAPQHRFLQFLFALFSKSFRAKCFNSCKSFKCVKFQLFRRFHLAIIAFVSRTFKSPNFRLVAQTSGNLPRRL